MKKVIIYKSYDDKDFLSEEECQKYELKCKTRLIEEKAAQINNYKDTVLPNVQGRYYMIKKLRNWKHYKTEYNSVQEAKIQYLIDRYFALMNLKNTIRTYKDLHEEFYRIVEEFRNKEKRRDTDTGRSC